LPHFHTHTDELVILSKIPEQTQQKTKFSLMFLAYTAQLADTTDTLPEYFLPLFVQLAQIMPAQLLKVVA
jgi:hypothetical protein